MNLAGAWQNSRQTSGRTSGKLKILRSTITASSTRGSCKNIHQILGGASSPHFYSGFLCMRKLVDQIKSCALGPPASSLWHQNKLKPVEVSGGGRGTPPLPPPHILEFPL